LDPGTAWFSPSPFDACAAVAGGGGRVDVTGVFLPLPFFFFFEEQVGRFAEAARQGSVAGSRAAKGLEQDHWLIPIEDRRQLPGKANQKARPGLAGSTSLGSYLLLVEYTGRLFRNGKANISVGVREVFERLGTSAEFWNHRVQKMLRSYSLRGNVFACNHERVQTLASERGQRVSNLCPQVAIE